MKINNKKNGYSIVEIIVYLAIFTTVSILVINSFIVIFSTFNVSRINRSLLNSGSTAMERMSREIRQANNVDIPNSTIGSSLGVLQLNSTDNGGSAIAIKFLVSNSVFKLYKNGNLIGDLTGQNILVTKLLFRRISTTKSEAVRVEMTLEKNGQSENFYDTIILRGGY